MSTVCRLLQSKPATIPLLAIGARFEIMHLCARACVCVLSVPEILEIRDWKSSCIRKYTFHYRSFGVVRVVANAS